MPVTQKPFGAMPDGRPISLYTITNKAGASVSIMNVGGNIVNLMIPDKNGKLADVILGFDDSQSYIERGAVYGALIGRFANRIAGGRFTLNGKEYQLNQNNNGNTLHGGPTGFGKRYWDMEIQGENAVACSLESPDGDENFPGNLSLKVVYTFDEQSALHLDYYAECDQDTIINLTNHAFFNLAGHESGDIRGHMMRIDADAVTATDEALIPTGELMDVTGTPYDLRQMTQMGAALDRRSEHPMTDAANGFDINYCLNGEGMRVVAEVQEPVSGRKMVVSTDLPGVQLFSTNRDSGAIGKGDARYGMWQAYCLETQFYPDAINHPNFPSPILRKGEKFHTCTIFAF